MTLVRFAQTHTARTPSRPESSRIQHRSLYEDRRPAARYGKQRKNNEHQQRGSHDRLPFVRFRVVEGGTSILPPGASGADVLGGACSSSRRPSGRSHQEFAAAGNDSRSSSRQTDARRREILQSWRHSHRAFGRRTRGLRSASPERTVYLQLSPESAFPGDLEEPGTPSTGRDSRPLDATAKPSDRTTHTSIAVLTVSPPFIESA